VANHRRSVAALRNRIRRSPRRRDGSGDPCGAPALEGTEPGRTRRGTGSPLQCVPAQSERSSSTRAITTPGEARSLRSPPRSTAHRKRRGYGDPSRRSSPRPSSGSTGATCAGFSSRSAIPQAAAEQCQWDGRERAAIAARLGAPCLRTRRGSRFFFCFSSHAETEHLGEVMQRARRQFFDRLGAQDGFRLGEPAVGFRPHGVGQPSRFGIRHRPRRLDDLAPTDRHLRRVGDTNAELPDASAPGKSGYSGQLLVASCGAVVQQSRLATL
jgi:hypothetical protein